jgi:hypothetical protein
MDVRSGIYRHYKGEHYLVLGLEGVRISEGEIGHSVTVVPRFEFIGSGL